MVGQATISGIKNNISSGFFEPWLVFFTNHFLHLLVAGAQVFARNITVIVMSETTDCSGGRESTLLQLAGSFCK